MNFNLPFRNNKSREAEDLGFGNRIIGEGSRLLDKNGKYNIRKTGRRAWTPYQDLVEMPWGMFLLVVLVLFVAVNAFFGLLLLLPGMNCLNGVIQGNFWIEFTQTFFFSVQTFTTVGYGAVSPACLASDLIASVIALTGLMAFALATGLFFARFSKPKSQIVFSKNALITTYGDGAKGFMFRIANRRDNQVINLEAKVTMSWVEDEGLGNKRRRFARLPLQIEKVVMLPLNWTIVHPIDENSPLFEKTAAGLKKMNVEVIVLIEGFDETYSQTVHASGSYCDEEVLWNVKFKAMYFPGKDGRTVLDLDAIDEVEKV